MDEQLSQGIGLFNDGEFFHCHEMLEEAWRLERRPRRLFLQALIHLAVGFYHAKRGNTVGAVRQLSKGIQKLAAYTPSCEGMDTARLYGRHSRPPSLSKRTCPYPRIRRFMRTSV